jgi:DivIVA domain-containing protein
MEAADRATPETGPPAESLPDAIRAASFRVAAVGGYQRGEVDEFLAALAERLEADDRGWDPDSLKRELERVGESTTAILTAAEQTARQLRADASRDADEIRRVASEDAERLRSEAEEEAGAAGEAAEEDARRVRVEANRKAEEMVSAAEARAEELIDEALRRRRVLEARIERLLERRQAVIEDTRRLAEDLSSAATDGERDPEGEQAPRTSS